MSEPLTPEELFELNRRAGDAIRAGGAEPITDKDLDCEVLCHEAHATPWKREHDPADCPANQDPRR